MPHQLLRWGIACVTVVIGVACQSDGDKQQARVLYRKATLTQIPDSVLYWCTEALRLDDQLIDAYRLRGVTYALQDSINSALSDFDRILSLRPNDAEAFINRGTALKLANRIEAALADHQKAIDLAPGNPEAWYNRALTYMQGGRDSLALADFNQAIVLRPDDGLFFVQRARLHARNKRFADAASDFDRAAMLRPSDAAGIRQELQALVEIAERERTGK